MGAPYHLLLPSSINPLHPLNPLQNPLPNFLRVLRVFAVQSSTTKSVAELPSYE
jgi:hypothetical protein